MGRKRRLVWRGNGWDSGLVGLLVGASWQGPDSVVGEVRPKAGEKQRKTFPGWTCGGQARADQPASGVSYTEWFCLHAGHSTLMSIVSSDYTELLCG